MNLTKTHVKGLLKDFGYKVSVLASVLALTFSFSATAYANSHDIADEPQAFLSWKLASLTNEARAARDLPPLYINSTLNRVAQLKAEHMARNGYFGHTSPGGLNPWYWFALAGYRFENAGENLAVNFTDTAAVKKAWLRSPSHRANIIDQDYTEVGTGIARGKLNGKEVVFIAQVYGQPAPASYW